MQITYTHLIHYHYYYIPSSHISVIQRIIKYLLYRWIWVHENFKICDKYIFLAFHFHTHEHTTRRKSFTEIQPDMLRLCTDTHGQKIPVILFSIVYR